MFAVNQQISLTIQPRRLWGVSEFKSLVINPQILLSYIRFPSYLKKKTVTCHEYNFMNFHKIWLGSRNSGDIYDHTHELHAIEVCNGSRCSRMCQLCSVC
jgi:hypothetical protein